MLTERHGRIEEGPRCLEVDAIVDVCGDLRRSQGVSVEAGRKDLSVQCGPVDDRRVQGGQAPGRAKESISPVEDLVTSEATI